MITAWRAAFNDPEMPFGVLSLCTDGTKQSLGNYSEMMANPGPWIREAQYQTFLEFFNAGDENIGFVSTYDLKRRWYHPQLKIPAGERIARWALATEYGFGKQLGWKPPMIIEMQAADGNITLRFDTSVGGVDDGGPMEGFAVAGEDRKFHPATIEYLVTGKDDRGRDKKDNKAIVLSSPMVPNPIHYRYAWGRNPMGNIQATGNSDIPLATQRSDEWPLEEAIVDAELKVLEGRQIGATLRTLDQERAIKEATTVLEGQKK
jgi:sialate O-acetylesterase